jgi:hypothetical protein
MCQSVEDPNDATIGRGKIDHDFWADRSDTEAVDSKKTGRKIKGNKNIIKSVAN